MRILSRLLVIVFLVAFTLVSPVTSGTVAANGFVRSISAGGSTTPQAAPSGDDSATQAPELFLSESEDGPAPFAGVIDRSLTQSGGGKNGTAASSKNAKSNPQLGLSFDGLNFRQQRVANNGNQFSVEPPDQGMCAGNGFVLESVNDVMRVFHQDGTPAMGVVDLNSFYGYAPAIVRSTLTQGPFVTDPSCLFDQQTQRWFNVVLTLEVTPTGRDRGRFQGPNHLDIAVSRTADPTGTWTIFRVPVQDDGTDGTPNHGCTLGSTRNRTNPRACIGDYPHIGADANGFYITTNEYSFFGNDFHGAQIYAFSKAALAASESSVRMVQFDTAGLVNTGTQTQPGFTVWPAQSPATQFKLDNGGTEYFLSSNAGDEATAPSGTAPGPGTSNQIILWTLANTSSITASSPALTLTNSVITVGQYAIPPKSNQKDGSAPLRDCLNNTACATFLNGVQGPTESLSKLDSNDTRIQQVTYANGKVWGALDTALTIDGHNVAGIEWFIVNPNNANLVMQGYAGLAGNNLIYPAIGVTESGRGVMAFTVVGNDYFPSAGYAAIDAKVGLGDVQIAAAGLGPQDGFSGYIIENLPNPVRPRWGDYGSASVDGNEIWIASEYIAQTCTLSQYTATPFGSCGGTRASLGNWGTRITKITP